MAKGKCTIAEIQIHDAHQTTEWILALSEHKMTTFELAKEPHNMVPEGGEQDQIQAGPVMCAKQWLD
jgi:hypothetical protein